MPPIMPFDIQKEIVGVLQAHPEVLRNLGAVCRQLNSLTRPILFRQVHIVSVPRLLHLSMLILTPFVTIPDNVASLSIEVQALKRADAQFPVNEVREALATVLDHFDTIRVAVTLELPWLVSRMLDWEYLVRSCRNLQKFVLSGTHSWPSGLVRALSHMASLDSLVINATWNSNEDKWDHLPNDATLPHNLKEICCSENSLGFLRWACSLDNRPQKLRVLRVKIDGLNSCFASVYVPPFLRKCGQKLEYLYLWFEEIPSYSPVYRDLGKGISQANLQLHQLEVFLPAVFEEEDDEEAYNDSQEEIDNIRDAIIGNAESHLFKIRIRSGYNIALNGEDFWEAPSGGSDCEPHGAALGEVETLSN